MLKQAAWLDAHIPDLKGKRFLVTGSSSGIGLESAKSLLYKGAEVTFAVRNEAKVKACIEKLKDEIPNPKTEIALYDQADPASIKAFVAGLDPKRNYDAIILNAAVYYPKKGSKAGDGTSLTFMTNAVGTYLLYNELREKFPKARYVFVDSIVNRTPHHRDYASYLGQGGNRRAEEYAVSKRAVMNIYGYGRIHHPEDALYMSHPGVSGTAIFDGFPPLIRKLGHKLLYLVVHHPWKACLGEVYLATAPLPAGTLAGPRGLFQISGYPRIIKTSEKKIFRDAEDLHLAFYRVYHV
jgi:hypothetical protein